MQNYYSTLINVIKKGTDKNQAMNIEQKQEVNKVLTFPSSIQIEQNVTRNQVKQQDNKLFQVFQQKKQLDMEIICKNYVKWMQKQLNEPSIGLNFIQAHFVYLYQDQKKEELKLQNKKLLIGISQIQETKIEIKQICQLSREWAQNMQNLIIEL